MFRPKPDIFLVTSDAEHSKDCVAESKLFTK